MDYEFRRDLMGAVKAQFSMGHEALACWINDEIAGNLPFLTDILSAIDSVRGSERQWQHTGREFSLLMDGEEVMVRANIMSFESDQLEDDMQYYDEESLSLCGLEDFEQALLAYQQFLAEER
ncbi:YacL family protein [Plesiomonas sp.]|uniref:YacL family protein n=1 Tax=Plesiomonas sp. TaxID=2486279 RepID=UPI003F36AC26